MLDTVTQIESARDTAKALDTDVDTDLNQGLARGHCVLSCVTNLLQMPQIPYMQLQI